jgi:hypothetical protein
MPGGVEVEEERIADFLKVERRRVTLYSACPCSRRRGTGSCLFGVYPFTVGVKKNKEGKRRVACTIATVKERKIEEALQRLVTRAGVMEVQLVTLH